MKAKRTNNPPQKHTVLKPTLVALTIMQSINTQAATIHVGGPLGQGCGLSAAILSANQDITHPGSQCVAGDGDDIIELHRDITIRKSWTVENSAGDKIPTHTGMPLIASNITINGNGHAISRDPSAPAFRLLRSYYGTTVSLNNIGLSNGKISPAISPRRELHGGAIFFEGASLTINNSQISGNENAVSGYESYVTIIDSNFSNNNDRAVVDISTANGANNSLYVKNSRFENNQTSAINVSAYSDYGSARSVEIIDSSFVNNAGVGIKVFKSATEEVYIIWNYSI